MVKAEDDTSSAGSGPDGHSEQADDASSAPGHSTFYRDDEPPRADELRISAVGLFDETQREMQAELERIDAMEDLVERERAAHEFRRRRRENLKNKIKAIHRQMEAQLALEFEKYEAMERDEVEETWRMEKRLQERAEERIREEREQREREEAERLALKSADELQQEKRDAFLSKAYTGQLFLVHKKGSLMKKDRQKEKFVKVSKDYEDNPNSITWGSGNNKHKILFDAVVNITAGHLSPTFQESRAPEELCFSVHTNKNTTLDLECADQGMRDEWMNGLKSLMTHLKKADGPSELPRRTSRLVKPRTVMPLPELFKETVEAVISNMEEKSESDRPDAKAYPIHKLAPYLYDKVVIERVGWKEWHEWIRQQFASLPAELPEVRRASAKNSSATAAPTPSENSSEYGTTS